MRPNNFKNEYPDVNEIIATLLKCKKSAIEEALRVGLIKTNDNFDSVCVFPIHSHVPKSNFNMSTLHELSDDEEKDDFHEVEK